MKKTVLYLFIATLSFCAQAQTTWKTDPMHSRAGFTIDHLGITDVTGFFEKFDVTVTTSKSDMSDGKFEFSADVNSINTSVKMRDDHLKSPDFFDAEKNPKITFSSTSLKKVSTNKYKVTGNLTLHGVTKSVTLDLYYRGTAKNPAANNDEVAGIQVTGVIKRSDFNLGTKFPAPMLSDEVVIKVDGEYAKAK
ncbi:hypothetical protein D3C87_244530 [compost metagenome]